MQEELEILKNLVRKLIFAISHLKIFRTEVLNFILVKLTFNI